MKKVSILGSRGIPAQYGGFETFAERLALYLKTHQGWEVTVYCQLFKEPTRNLEISEWKGIQLIQIDTPFNNALGSILFDLKSTFHAVASDGIILTLGYNTAVFSIFYKFRSVINIINMDGLEWKRQKWKWYEKAWLYFNERAACQLATHLIADNPGIQDHLIYQVPLSKISMIPYCADPIQQTDLSVLETYNLATEKYALLVARPEPENSIYEIVKAFSRIPRGIKLVILGRYLPDRFRYHRQIIQASSDEVIFLGAIYDKITVNTLRCQACLYLHGHTVGGTNPSLIESLAAGLPVLAHDNQFNRWVLEQAGHYFKSIDDCAQSLDYLLDAPEQLQKMRKAAYQRYQDCFAHNEDVIAYGALLENFMP